MGDNAWETYQAVLQLDPNNRRAVEGLENIAGGLESLARGKQQKGDLPESLAIVEDGLSVLPSHSGLLALKEEIARQMEAKRAAEKVEEQSAKAEPKSKTKKRRRVKTFGSFF